MNTETITVFPPDEGFSEFDASPAQIAARVSSLNVAAGLILTEDNLTDQRLKAQVIQDLMETAAWLARKLANYHDDLDQQRQSG